MRESRTYGSGRGACDETRVPTATLANVPSPGHRARPPSYDKLRHLRHERFHLQHHQFFRRAGERRRDAECDDPMLCARVGAEPERSRCFQRFANNGVHVEAKRNRRTERQFCLAVPTAVDPDHSLKPTSGEHQGRMRRDKAAAA
jgi:hypothetical protein